MIMTTAERRAYRQICGPDGLVMAIAADQRGGMRELLSPDPAGRAAITDAMLGETKADIVTHLAAHASAILLDPLCALPWIVDRDILPRDLGLIVGLDASGFDLDGPFRLSRLSPGITARRVRALGGTAGKMMIYLRPDQPAANAANLAMLDAVIADFRAEDVLLVTEFLTYRLPDESAEAYGARTEALVLGGVELCLRLHANLLKIPWPGSPEACAAVTARCGPVPWTILSAGVDHARFLPQVETAMAAGAKGVIAGRALWKDCIDLDRDETRARLTARAVPRLRELQAVLARHRPA